MSHPITSAVPARLSTWAEDGMTTAEYAVGTVSACSFAGLLFKLLTSDFGQNLLESLLSKITSLLPF
jgi:Protein of unknown function (DUF4244)